MKTIKIWEKLMEMYKIKKLIFCMYEMLEISHETWGWGGDDIGVILDNNGALWLNEKHIKEKLAIQIYQSSETSMTHNIKNTD